MSVLCNFHIDDTHLQFWRGETNGCNPIVKTSFLIGAGVLSTTFGSMLKEVSQTGISTFTNAWIVLQSKVQTKEIMLVRVMQHYELNYTVLQPDGSIDIRKRK